MLKKRLHDNHFRCHFDNITPLIKLFSPKDNCETANNKYYLLNQRLSALSLPTSDNWHHHVRRQFTYIMTSNNFEMKTLAFPQKSQNTNKTYLGECNTVDFLP